jgi:hypothetical protein
MNTQEGYVCLLQVGRNCSDRMTSLMKSDAEKVRVGIRARGRGRMAGLAGIESDCVGAGLVGKGLLSFKL